MKALIVVVALSVMLASAPAFAQAPSGTAPKPAPAPAAPASQQPPATPPAPKPFPQGSKVAYVVLQRIANESADGRVATTRIQALQQKKAAELNEKNKQLTTMQQKLEKEGSVMNASAAADLQKNIERVNLEVQRFTQDAQAEVQELQQTLQQEFQQRLEPVLQQVASDMGLQFVFNGPDAGLVWADSALDISSEVIKKLDSAKPPAAGPAANPAVKPPPPVPMPKPPGQ
ncbi:MAG TPA: OmpH family outer membrane protein [Vicinamibacterales bacterium]|nr:OmpH family outer membrane protein [Vicinamibacterales bacterium]